jgi:hypothetical protein
MSQFKMVTDQRPAGDQPEAIAGLVESIRQGNRYQTLLGVTGSGKSVAADTPVLVKRGPYIRAERIGGFIDHLMDRESARVRRVGDTEILDEADLNEPLETFSFDPQTGHATWKPIRQMLRHRSPDTLWQVRTACGRVVTVTGDHNFFVLRDGRLSLLPTQEIRPGDYLPVPRRLPEPITPLERLPVEEMFDDGARIYVTLPLLSEVWKTHEPVLRPVLPARHAYAKVRGAPVSLATYKQATAALPVLAAGARFSTRNGKHGIVGGLEFDDQLLRLIGYYIGEGHAEPPYFIISSADDEMVVDYLAALHGLGLHTTQRPGTYDYSTCSSLWSRLFAQWCGRDARSKRLPPFWTRLSNAHLAQILRAYFSADGGTEAAEVTCTTTSRTLASDLCLALLRFGIVARMRERRMKVPGSSERRDYWQIRVSGQPFLRAFRDEIGFATTRSARAWMRWSDDQRIRTSTSSPSVGQICDACVCAWD